MKERGCQGNRLEYHQPVSSPQGPVGHESMVRGLFPLTGSIPCSKFCLIFICFRFRLGFQVQPFFIFPPRVKNIFFFDLTYLVINTTHTFKKGTNGHSKNSALLFFPFFFFSSFLINTPNMNSDTSHGVKAPFPLGRQWRPQATHTSDNLSTAVGIPMTLLTLDDPLE